MKKLLIILAITLMSCTNEEEKDCGKIQQKGRQYNGNGYVYTFKVNGNIFEVNEGVYNSYKNNEEYCR